MPVISFSFQEAKILMSNPSRPRRKISFCSVIVGKNFQCLTYLNFLPMPFWLQEGGQDMHCLCVNLCLRLLLH